MAAKFKESRNVRCRLYLSLSDHDDITVTLDNQATGDWDLILPNNSKFTIQEIIDICGAVYDSGIVKEDYTFGLNYEGDNHKVFIRGRKTIMESVLNQFKIPFGIQE